MNTPLAETLNKKLFGFPDLVANTVLPILEKLSFLPVLGLRLWIANVFWKSGLTKIATWSSTIDLFAYEYKVPLLSPELAAQMGTAVELGAPVLLLLGLGARPAAAALLVMTAVIEFTYESYPIHQVWALILLLILFQGAGKASLDYFIRKFFQK